MLKNKIECKKSQSKKNQQNKRIITKFDKKKIIDDEITEKITL